FFLSSSRDELDLFRQFPTEDFLDPSIFPRQTGNAQLATEIRGKLFQLLNDIRPLWIETGEPRLQVIQACHSSSLTVLKRPKIVDVQPHGQELRLQLPVGPTDIGHTIAI